MKAYDAALQLRPNDADSQFNRDLVRRKLEALKKKQSTQDQQKQSGGGAQQKKQPENSQTKDQKQARQQSGQQAQNKGQQKGSQAKDQKQTQQQSDQQARNKGQQKDSQSQGKQQSQQQSDQLAQNSNQQKTTAAPGHDTAQPQNLSEPSGQLAPRPSPSAGQPQGAHQGSGLDQREDKAADLADSQHLPGDMSREEARALLDSVKDEEHRLPTAPVARNSTNDSASDEPIKDW